MCTWHCGCKGPVESPRHPLRVLRPAVAAAFRKIGEACGARDALQLHTESVLICAASRAGRLKN